MPFLPPQSRGWNVCLGFGLGLAALLGTLTAGLFAWWRTPAGRTALLPLALAVAGPPEVAMVEAHAHAQTPDQAVVEATGDPDADQMAEGLAEIASPVVSLVPDTEGYGAVLSAFVDANGFVDYQGIAADSESLAALSAYVASLADTDLDTLTRDERLATLINAYNAFTLRLILDHSREASIDSIYDISEAERWKAARWRLGGETVSLDQLEHEVIRPNFREARVHWALVCAAFSCPKLRNEPYTGERLEAQLTDQAAYVHQDKRFFYFDDRGRLYLTELYRWFAGDFEQVDGSPLKHAAKYSPELAARLAKDDIPKVLYIPYDWSLNSQAKHAANK